MYSEFVESSGISQHTLEVLVLGTIGVFILGVIFFLYWKQIVIGCLALTAVVVLANHRPKTPVVPKVEQEQVIIEVEKPVEKKISIEEGVDPQPTNKEELMTKPEDNRKYFLEDCLQYTDYTKAQCEAIWDKRDSADTKLLDVENVEYKERRAKALKKPNAVVAHYTLR